MQESDRNRGRKPKFAIVMFRKPTAERRLGFRRSIKNASWSPRPKNRPFRPLSQFQKHQIWFSLQICRYPGHTNFSTDTTVVGAMGVGTGSL